MLAALALAPVGLWLCFPNRGSNLFYRIQEAYIRADWDRALRLINSFSAAMQGKVEDGFIRMVVAEWKGRGLARTNRVDQAIAGVEALRNDPAVPPATFWYLMATVHLAARDLENALLCWDRVIESDPESPAGWMGKIDLLAVWMGRPAEARAAMEQVRRHPTSPQSQWALDYSEAMVLLAESKFAHARTLFERTLPQVKRQARIAPFGIGLLAVFRTQLAIACARTGDAGAARAHFEAARPFLELHKSEPLLSRARREVGAG